MLTNSFKSVRRLFSFIGLVLIFLSGMVVFNGCSSEKEKTTIDPAYSAYVSGYTAGVISKYSAITIRLAQDVMDSLKLDESFAQKLFDFSPSIKGSAYWVDARTIEFKPESKLKSGEHYRVKFELGKVVEVPDNLSSFEYDLQTITQNYDINIEGLNTYELTDLKRQKLIGKVMTADKEDNENIEKLLTAKQDGKELTINWEHNGENNSASFIVEEVVRGDDEGEVLLFANGSPIGVDKEEKLEYAVPALGNFTVMEASVIQSPDQYVSIRFSDPLQENQNLNGLIQIGQLSSLRYLINGNELRVYPPVRQTGQKMVTINKGLKNILGYKLTKEQSVEVLFEQIKPAVRLVGKGVILPATDGLVFPFEAVSLNAVDVKIIKIYENNIPQFLQNNNLSGNNELRRVGYPVVNKKVPLNTTGVTDFSKWTRYTLDLSEMIKAEPGAIYQVEIGFRKNYSTYYCEGQEESNDLESVDDNLAGWDSNTEEESSYWDYYDEYYYDDYNWSERDNPCHNTYYRNNRKVTRNVLASDLGLIVKKGKNNELFVAVTDLKTTEPLKGIEVNAYDYQNQVINSGVTGSDGIANIAIKRNPYLLIAKNGEQRGYLKLDDGSSLSLSNFNVSGEVVQKGIKGYLYGERGVWRPGDSLHIAFILEDKEKVLPEQHPVIFELYNPRGQVEEKMVQSFSEHGIYNFSTKTSDDAITGNWNARVQVGGAVFEKALTIETVKPNRLKINLDFGIDKIVAGSESVYGNLEVKWLHGAIAKNLRAVFDVMLSPSTTSFEDFPNHTFDDPSRMFYPEKEEIFDGYIDEQGKAKIYVSVHPESSPAGVCKAYFSGKVFEESGDFSIDRFSIPYYPYDSYVGVMMPEGDSRGMLLTDTTHFVDVVTVNADGKPVSKSNLSVEIYKLSWRWWWDNSSDNISNYVNSSYHSPLYETTVSTNAKGRGRASFKINYPEWGRYFIRIYDAQSGHSTGKIFYADWPGWAGKAKRDMPGTATMLSFSTDKSKYSVGEKINISIPGSDVGRALVSVENGNKVLKSWWVNTQKGETPFTIEATPEMSPNVYVYVTLVQPHQQTVNDLPIRLYGVVPIKVEDPETHLYPLLAMNDVLEPGEEVTLKVTEKNGHPMAYTIAMVDEGLLDLTRFKTPDPYGRFYAREALGVKTWDLFDDVIGAYGGQLERILAIGGDDEGEDDKDQSKANRFKPVVKFLGPFYIGKGDKGVHKFTMPHYVGSVRTMVVAAHEGSYGSTEKTTPVRKPLMVLATLPRVLGPGENVKLPVSVFAMEENIKEVKVELTASDIFEVNGKKTQTITFSEPTDQLVEFEMKVKEHIGIGKVKITVSSGSNKATDEIEIDVRNPNPPLTNVYDGLVEAGKSWSKTFQAVGMAGTNTASFEVSSIPPINLDRRLKYLIQYPHGCIEQTTSSAFPQLFLANFVEMTPAMKAEIEKNVKATIQRLKLFQLDDGGFVYWPGNEEPNPWGTNYAGHFLLEAQNKGYAVPQSMIRKWVKYQKGKANEWKKNDSKYRNDLIQAYRLYTLALADEAQTGAMNRMKEEKDLSIQASWRLAAAYGLAGMPEVAKSIIGGLSKDIQKYQELSYTYGDRTRDLAMILETLSVVKNRGDGVAVMKQISQDLSDNQKWMSTQSTAYSLLAIGKFLEDDKTSEGIKCTYKLNDESSVKASTELSVFKNDFTVNNGNNSISINNTGKGMLFVRVTNTGVPVNGDTTSASNSLKLSITYRDSDGYSIDPATIVQGSEITAEVSVYNPGLRGEYKEMALSQIFPSGWEILNSRMDKTIENTQEKAKYQDIRDDRVYTYFDLKPHERKTFVLHINASYLGRFYLPTISCEAMYDNTINARVPGKWITVVKDKVQ